MYLKTIILITTTSTIGCMYSQNVNKVNFPYYTENTRTEIRIPEQINGLNISLMVQSLQACV